MAHNVQFGFDIEGVVKIGNRIMLGPDVAPEQKDAKWRQTDGPCNSIRMYRDGAAVECGSAQPPYCLAYALDNIYHALALMGDKRKGYPGVDTKHSLIWQDVVKINPKRIDNAPEEVKFSGCHPRLSCETMNIGDGPRPYDVFLKKVGIPVGCHLHFGSPSIASDNMAIIVKCLVVKCLTWYASTNPIGGIERWKAFGVGMFRPTSYGLEWTDPGLCMAYNAIMLAAVMGDARLFIEACRYRKELVDAFLKAVPFEAAKEAILNGPEAAREIAVAAHKEASKLITVRSVVGPYDDDTVTWSTIGYNGQPISSWFLKLIEGGMPEQKHGWWTVPHIPHSTGIHSGLNRMFSSGAIK